MEIAAGRPLLCPIVIGRDRALDAVGRWLERGARRTDQILVVTGEAGIGKSRLVAEAVISAGKLGYEVRTGRCFEPDRALPFAPLIDLLETRLATIPAGDVEGEFGPVAAELLPLVPELALRLSALVAPPRLDPAQDRRRLFSALASYVMERATTAPQLVVIEDLHWSDETSLDALLFLTRRIGGRPILLLLTYRQDETSPALDHFLAELDRSRMATEVALDRLPAADLDAMVRAIFGLGRPINAAFLDLLTDLTDGNPFFVEEVLAALVAGGDISLSGESWTWREIAALRPPRSVQDAVRRRVAAVSPVARDALRWAAVAGRRFDFGLLETALGRDEAALVDAIKELVAARLVVEESADRFAFRHALTRQAVYGALLERERRDLHRRLAEVIEQSTGDRMETVASDLAYHFAAAEKWDKTLHYARLAGEQARAIDSPRAAVIQFSRAIEAMRALSALPSPALFQARGQAYETLGAFEAALADYEAALPVARARGDRAGEVQVRLDLGLLWASRDYRAAGEHVEQALTLAREIGDPILLARSLNRVGNRWLNAGDPEVSRRYHEEALAVFRGANDRQGMAETLDLLGTALGQDGDAPAAAAVMDEAIALFREENNRRGLVNTLVMSAMLAMLHPAMYDIAAETDVDDALARVDEALVLTREIDWRSGEAFVHLQATYCFQAVGDYGRVLEAARACLTIATEIDHRQWQAAGSLAMGGIALDLAQYAAARRNLEATIRIATEVGSEYWRQMASVYLVMVTMLDGDLETAESLLAGIDAPGHSSRSAFGLPARRLRAEIALRRGEPAGAGDA